MTANSQSKPIRKSLWQDLLDGFESNNPVFIRGVKPASKNDDQKETVT